MAGGTSVEFCVALANAEPYDLATGIWSAPGPLATARNSKTAALLPTGTVLVVGGSNEGGVLACTELLTFH